MIKFYDGLAALKHEHIRLGSSGHGTRNPNSSWYGNESAEQILLRTEIGDTTLVPKAEKLMDELETQIEVPKRIWERSPAGAFCVVPDVLAGLPTYMRHQREVGDEHQPVDIIVDVGCSAQLKADTLIKRGTTILALVLALGRVRPISLKIIDCGDGNQDGTGESVLVTTINTAPLDLASACYGLTSVGLVRWLIFGLEEKLNEFAGGWPKGFNLYNPQPYYDKLLPRITTNDLSRTLLIPAARVTDTLLSDPVPWLNAQIARFTNQDSEND